MWRILYHPKIHSSYGVSEKKYTIIHGYFNSYGDVVHTYSNLQLLNRTTWKKFYEKQSFQMGKIELKNI